MSNLFYSSPTDIAAVTKALSYDINTIDAAVDTAFDKLPTELHLKRGTTHYAVDTGVVNAYVIALPYTPSGYVDGLVIEFRALATNTTAATINVSGLGVKSLRRADGSALSPGDITLGVPVRAVYSTATGFFHMSGSSSVDAAAAAASAVSALASQVSATASQASATASQVSATASQASATASENTASNAAADALASELSATASQISATASQASATASAATAVTKASEASVSAAAALVSEGIATAAAAFAAGLVGTSTSSLTIAIAPKTFTTQASKQFAAGQFVLAVSAANNANYMHGQVTSYAGTTLIVDVQDVGGSGTLADWNLSVSGSRGAVGAAGATTTYLRKTANYTAVANDAVLASTTAGAWTLELPATPTQFDKVGPIIDTDGTWQTNNLTIARNGSNIMGLAENMTCAMKYGAFSLEYDSTTGWRLY